MNETEKLAMLKVLLGITDNTQDAILTVYLTLAANKVLRKAYPYDGTKTEVPSQYADKQCEIAAYLFNKRGAEGQTAHTENGISRQYERGDVPESLMGVIVPYCGTFSPPVETAGEG